MAVALMRTFGVAVTRSGKAYSATLGGAPAPPPIALELRAAASSVRADGELPIEIVETATSSGVWLSYAGTVSWNARWSESGASMWDDGPRAPFADEGSVPRSEFVSLATGDRRSSVYPIRLGHPGHYKLTANKVYYRDGGGAGLDAWTGAVVSAPIEIDVTE